MDTLHVTYLLDVEPGSEFSRAENVALEQTVEVPRSAICDAFVASEIQGRVEEIAEAPEGGFLATIAYSAETTAFDPAQLINVVFGNSSLHADIQCVDIELPTSVSVAMQGPQFGISGIRKAVGIYDRPLTCTAIKPMGLSPDALAFEFTEQLVRILKAPREPVGQNRNRGRDAGKYRPRPRDCPMGSVRDRIAV